MKAQLTSLLLGAAGTLFALTATAASPEHQRAIGSAREALDAFDLARARSWLEVALATSENPKERAVAWDLKGGLEGIENNYGAAFKAFFAAARLGGTELVTGRENPKTATRRVATCAVRLAEAGLRLAEAEARLRSENRVETWAGLDDALRTLLFENRFACPKISRAEDALAEVTPPVGRPPSGTPPEAPPGPSPESPSGPPGDSQTVDLNVPSGGLEVPPAASWILGGVAVAAAGTGGVLAGIAWDEAGTAGGSNIDDDLASVDDKLTAANVAYATAGVAAVGAVLFWILDGGDEDATAEVDVGPGAFSVRF